MQEMMNLMGLPRGRVLLTAKQFTTIAKDRWCGRLVVPLDGVTFS